MSWLLHYMILEIDEGFLPLNTTKDIWDLSLGPTPNERLDHLTDYTPICFADTTAFQKFIDRKWISKFLQAYEMSMIRSGRILNMDPVPSLREAFAFIQNEESCRDKLHCDYCQRPRHARETCWHLHVYSRTSGHSGSADGRGGSSRAHHSIVVEPPLSSSESVTLSTTEIELIRNVMSQLDTSANALSSFAHSSNFARSGSLNEDND
ncbi:hypothetical protein Acr_00g0068870 [Actinidia rufa]|uniref:Uncharacterized protein n=1 Tax=Actinidia rufa TaxID=165716 RepID=A0A7J0DR26_9ERIC|nr:hypothetical protein Acr_00g0068870 [Actinidia rufa]